MRSLPLLFLSLFLALTPASSGAEGLLGKVMCGYQGWFRVPEDGSKNGWFHYSPKKTFEPGVCSVELWPDVRELPASDRFATGFKHADGSTAEVFSSVRPATTKLHFQWMREYGIDGVFLQRFAVSTRDQRFREPMDTVLENCRSAAKETGREWALMYDLSGVKPGEIDLVINDWKHVQEKFRLTDATANPAYLHHRGKPLVALWGLGFSDRAPMLDEWKRLLEFLKNDPQFGGCSLMVGVPTFWRTLDRDAVADPLLHELIGLADVVSPWTVGRYDTPERAASHAIKTAKEDIVWCQAKSLDYLPVCFPGFSWHNLSAGRGTEAPLNAIPRLGGRFLWSQFVNAQRVGAKMLYVAMFDELDEATAIFKCRQDPPVGSTPFLTETEVPNDHYLWLTGMAKRLLQGEIPATDEPPPRAAK